MLMRENDELDIQKCIDNELSSRETSELLRRLDGIADGWKTLACGLLEDRRLNSILTSDNNTAASKRPAQQLSLAGFTAFPPQKQHAPDVDHGVHPAAVLAKDDTRVIKVNDVVRHWWSHPVTSLTLCAAIAFVGGLLIPDLNDTRPASNTALSRTDAPTRSSLHPSAVNGAQQYRVELQPGGRSVEIPVVTDLSKLHELDRRHPIFLGSKGDSENVRWMVLPVEGNKSMLIPVSEDSSTDMQ